VRAAPLALFLLTVACSGEPKWNVVHRDLPGALISVWGTSATDVWAVGGDPGDGGGPMVLHFDGTQWTRLQTGATADLWWVFGFAGGPIYMGGSGGTILRYQDGTFTPMTTPTSDTVFGIWGSSPSDVWAVGGALGGASGAFAWKVDGDAWVPAEGFPAELAADSVVWKIYGASADDVWLVGTNGLVVHWDGDTFTPDDTGAGESLFTVHHAGGRYVAVGGFGTATVLENDGDGWVSASPAGAPPLIGVFMTEDGGWAVGQFGSVYRRESEGWVEEETKIFADEAFHAVWVDPDGGIWAVGGQVLTTPLTRGIMLHKGDEIPTEVVDGS
jgi:hypothetical protein